MKRLSAPLVAIVLCCALPVELRAQAVQNIVLRNSFSLCLLFNSSTGTSSQRALKAEMRARTNDEIM